MAGRLYALLVGINRYPPEVGELYGCVNDVAAWEAHLREGSHGRDLALETLRDGEATRAQLIHAFRAHLGQAGPDDVALFHYSGHGARWRSAAAFRSAFPDGMDEGLVCIDSRSPGGYDLADKELAVLIDEVAARGAHVAVMLDCCHAGSGTRNADAFRGLRARVTHEVQEERPLESYLDGHYADRLASGRPLIVPAGRHVLLAACERTQQARETRANQGVFSATLLEVLLKSGGATRYAELFVRCRDAVRLRADDQSPQFETLGNFDAWSGVLGRPVDRPARRYSIAWADSASAWRVDAGAVQGISTDPDRPATLAVYREDDDRVAIGSARIERVGAQRSELRLDFAAATGERFRASLQSLPAAPLWVWAAPGSGERAALQAELDGDGSTGVAIAEVPDSALYDIARRGSDLVVRRHASPVVVHTVTADADQPAADPKLLAAALAHLAHWERIRLLTNRATRIAADAIEWVCVEPAATGGPGGMGRREAPTVHTGPEVILDGCDLSADGAAEVRAQFRVRNRSGQTLHVLLLHLSAEFGIASLYSEPLPSGDTWVTLYGDDKDDCFWVAGDEAEAIDRFKLVVSASKVDGFLFSCEPLAAAMLRHRGVGRRTEASRKFDDDEWATSDRTVRTVRRLDEVGAQDWSSQNGRLKVMGHPSLTASISLSTLAAGGRGDARELPSFLPGFIRAGLEPVGFGTSRSGADSVLELTNIQHADRLREQPLEVVIDIPLTEDEGILSVVFDGQHLLLGGHAMKDDAGLTRITIDHLPVLPSERRSLGSALKLYFFKTYLRRPQVNRLSAVRVDTDGNISRSTVDLASRVAKAEKILLLVHGIIGDTDGMATGLQACGLAARFDLVLAYDYENLATPIPMTARQLASDLSAIGIGPEDGRHLTMLVHSMGGLVARWFIEREGGQTSVDHLVMCGTPNQGSPFGKVGDARAVVSLLTGLAANAAPWLLPYTTPLLFLLNRSARLTPTLEEMAEHSDFMQALNSGEHPVVVRYTVLAGNVADYDEPGDPMFARLVTKLGQGTAFELLFGHRPNDIAVTVASILGGAEGRAGAACHPVACHHLNYFSSRAGQAALVALGW